MSDDFLDGNVMAGALSEVFDLDITTVQGQCANCGDIAVLARSLVFGLPMGFVMRCRRCDNVLAVLVDATPRRRLAMRGLRWIDIDG